MRIIFMGTPEFAVPALEALAQAGHEIGCVYTQPPRPAGRGKKLRPSPVQVAAEARAIPVRSPLSLRSKAEQAAFAALDADAAVVAAYGLILPRAVLEAPRRGCLNIHASLLPRWRGAAPIHHAILAGDEETGVTIMQMDEGLDTGPMLLSERTAIGNKTAGELAEELAQMGARLMVEALERLGTLVPRPQDEALATYAPKIDKRDARIDWSRPAGEIERQVRAMAPYPGAWFELAGERVRLLLAEIAEGQGQPGEILDPQLTIACGQGAIRALRLQRAGRAAMTREEFLRGWPVRPGMAVS